MRHWAAAAGVALAALAGAARGGAEEWRSDVPCGERLGAPVATSLAGCASSACVVLRNGRICSCLAEGAEALAMVWEERGAQRARWDVELRGLPDARAFEVVRLPLGQPPQQALLVAAKVGESNGMGIEYHSVRALLGGNLSNEVEVQDYGTLSFATRAGSAKECRLLATRWLWASDPTRGGGLYLYARWFHLRGTELAPDPERPLIARRYLFRFERERLAALNARERRPLRWFRAATAHPPACGDPFSVEAKDARRCDALLEDSP